MKCFNLKKMEIGVHLKNTQLFISFLHFFFIFLKKFEKNLKLFEK